MRIITSIAGNEQTEPALVNIEDKYLYLVACGRQALTNTNHIFRCIRPEGKCKNYMLQIVLAGKGHHTLNHETTIINAGQCILYEPNTPQHIIHYGEDNADVIWMHFSGFGVEEIVTSLGLRGISTLTNTTGFKQLLLQMVQELTSPSQNSYLICQNYLLNFLLTCSQRVKGQSPHNLLSGKISPALNHIINNYAKHSLSIHEYAQMCFMSDSRFSHLFREVTGTTPHKYILQKRIDNAKALLSGSDIKISEVAAYVGFSDPYHFSRVFSKDVGMSPSQYRQQLQCEVSEDEEGEMM